MRINILAISIMPDKYSIHLMAMNLLSVSSTSSIHNNGGGKSKSVHIVNGLCFPEGIAVGFHNYFHVGRITTTHGYGTGYTS